MQEGGHPKDNDRKRGEEEEEEEEEEALELRRRSLHVARDGSVFVGDKKVDEKCYRTLSPAAPPSTLSPAAPSAPMMYRTLSSVRPPPSKIAKLDGSALPRCTSSLGHSFVPVSEGVSPWTDTMLSDMTFPVSLADHWVARGPAWIPEGTVITVDLPTEGTVFLIVDPYEDGGWVEQVSKTDGWEVHPQHPLGEAMGGKEVWGRTTCAPSAVALPATTRSAFGCTVIAALGAQHEGAHPLSQLGRQPAARLPCDYFALCRQAMGSMFETVPKALFDPTFDKCYCHTCYPPHLPDLGPSSPTPYEIPRGWARFGLRVPPQAHAEDVFHTWGVSFHGCTVQIAGSIIRMGDMCIPGDTLPDGTTLKSKNCLGKTPSVYYTSPTVKYAGICLYARPTLVEMDEKQVYMQVVLQCRQRPESYMVQPETVAFVKSWGWEQERLSKHFKLAEVEWLSSRRRCVIPYGVLVRVFPESSPPPYVGFRSPNDPLYCIEAFPWDGKTDAERESLLEGTLNKHFTVSSYCGERSRKRHPVEAILVPSPFPFWVAKTTVASPTGVALVASDVVTVGSVQIDGNEENPPRGGTLWTFPSEEASPLAHMTLLEFLSNPPSHLPPGSQSVKWEMTALTTTVPLSPTPVHTIILHFTAADKMLVGVAVAAVVIRS